MKVKIKVKFKTVDLDSKNSGLIQIPIFLHILYFEVDTVILLIYMTIPQISYIEFLHLVSTQIK